jgi:hypothetical protein
VPGSYVFENKRKCFAENAEVVGLDFDLIWFDLDFLSESWGR